MVENKTKYVINVDFPTISRVHLNPYYFGDMWCRLDEEKMRRDGGKVYVTGEEAQCYLSGEEALLFDGRPVKNLQRCSNCSRRGKQSIHWDIRQWMYQEMDVNEEIVGKRTGRGFTKVDKLSQVLKILQAAVQGI